MDHQNHNNLSHGIRSSKANSILLDTNIGQLRARLETCHPRTSTAGDNRSVDVVKCLGIPFAKIPYRWASPRAETVPWIGVKDATNFGPQCPQASDPLFNVDIPVFGKLGKYSFPVQSDIHDEFNCLNLNVFAPLEFLPQGKRHLQKLPVLVWVHGGGQWTGTGGVDLYDGSELVARSVRIGSPLIVVTCNYRLGVLGYLHSRELALDAAKQEDVPSEFRSTGNLGLLDTYMAFQWVKNRISNFGGDPDNITGIGESAGAVILNYLALFRHLHVKVPRMILSSTTVFAHHPILASEAQTWFDSICDKCGVPRNTEETVSLLRQIPVESLILHTNFARSAFRPTWDDITITYDARSVLKDPSLWDDKLEEIIFGHCENESWLRLASFPSAAKNKHILINGRVPPIKDLRGRVVDIYSASMVEKYKWYQRGISIGMSDDDLCWMALEGHAKYYAVTQLLSNTLINSKSAAGKKRVLYKYILCWTPKNWPQDCPATHTADILPTFLHKSFTSDDLKVAYTFADQLIFFAASSSERMTWRKFEGEDRMLNVLTRQGSWDIMKEGSGEFGLREECVRFWNDVVSASIKLGREGWPGITR
ncbi:Alpha/Beta hydrolase protein [Xylogone sp. PMI_703]|nr:Alpha/Beta hydrolase protein [Xylogone sp. PMI_703]